MITKPPAVWPQQAAAQQASNTPAASPIMEAAMCTAGAVVGTAAAVPEQKKQTEADPDMQFSMSMQDAYRVADAAPGRKHMVSAPH